MIRQDNGGSPVERLSVEERAPAAADDAVAATDATSSTTVTTAKSTPSPTATRDPTDNGHAEPHVQEEHYSDGDSSSYAGVLFIGKQPKVVKIEVVVQWCPGSLSSF